VPGEPRQSATFGKRASAIDCGVVSGPSHAVDVETCIGRGHLDVRQLSGRAGVSTIARQLSAAEPGRQDQAVVDRDVW
jgi:hypothetical protein